MPRTSMLSALALLVLVAGVVVGTATAVVADDTTSNKRVADTGTAQAINNRVLAAINNGALDVTSIPNTTNYLTIDVPTRRSYVRSDLNVVAASGISAEALHVRHANRTFNQRFGAEEMNATERITLVRTAADRASRRLDRLGARQGTLFRSYSNGTLSREAFLHRYGLLTAKAQLTSGYLQHVKTRVDNSLETTIPIALETRITAIQTKPVALPGPVSKRLRRGLVGERKPLPVYIEGGNGGLVMGTVDGGEFFRQATIRTEYAPSRPDQFDQADKQSISLAFQRAGELYPWAYSNAIGGPQIRGFGQTSIYHVSVDHPQGSLEAYISGGTRNVFYEIQRQRPSAVPVTQTGNKTNNSLQLTVEQTTRTGPMRVSLTRPTADAPVDGAIAINGQVIGRTGKDGQLWTVQPSGQVRVNATVGDNSVTLLAS